MPTVSLPEDAGEDLAVHEAGFRCSPLVTQASIHMGVKTANPLLACLLTPLNSHRLFKGVASSSNSHRKAANVWEGMSLPGTPLRIQEALVACC